MMPLTELEGSLLTDPERLRDVVTAPRERPRLVSVPLGEDHTELPSGTSITVYEMIGKRVGMDVKAESKGDKLDLVVRSRDGHGTLRFWREYGNHVRRNPAEKLIAAAVWNIRNGVASRRQQPNPQA